MQSKAPEISRRTSSSEVSGLWCLFLLCLTFVLVAMKADRKKLKAENFDLHMQMKQLYCTLGDKEAELRDFIRTYDQHKSDRQDSFKQVLIFVDYKCV